MSPPAELTALLARSRAIGADESLVVHGGGNTSAKGWATDHLGQKRPVMWVKGSGSDLATATLDDFPALFLDEVLPLRQRQSMGDDEMMAYLRHCLFEPTSPRPSIETLLHAFLPAAHVDHVHADAIVALTNTPDWRRIVTEALGEKVALIEFVRPGFDLSKRVAGLVDREAVVLRHHGLVTWGESSDEALARTREVVDRAEAYLSSRLAGSAPSAPVADLEPEAVEALVLRLRNQLSVDGPRVMRIDGRLRRVADRPDLERVVEAGAATADHILRTRPRSVTIRRSDGVDDAVAAWSRDYESYVDRHRSQLPPGVTPRPPLPTVALVPGLGAITAGATARQAEVVADIAVHTHAVAARSIDSLGGAEAMAEADTFSIDHWPLELDKLARIPPPPELGGRIYCVSGAASGIGRAITSRLVALGAAVVAGDVDAPRLEQLAEDLPGLVTRAGDLTDRPVAEGLVDAAVANFGGLDGIVVSAGIAPTGNLVDTSDDDWHRVMEVNLTSAFVLTRRALRVLARQGMGGSLVYIASKNAFGPGAGFGAYSTSKAGLVQLTRIAALEGGPLGVRANAVNPDAVFEGSKLWSDDLRRERAAAHGVAVEELEDFYAQRNLLHSRVMPADVAEAVAFLLSPRSAKTTGAVIPVDGGVAMAFPR